MGPTPEPPQARPWTRDGLAPSRLTFHSEGFTARFGAPLVPPGVEGFVELGGVVLAVGLAAVGVVTGSLFLVGMITAALAGSMVAVVLAFERFTLWDLRATSGAFRLTWTRGPFHRGVDLPFAGLLVDARHGSLLLRSGARSWRLSLVGWDATSTEELLAQVRERAAWARRRQEPPSPAAQALLDAVARKLPGA